ncbi:MAG: FAD-binding oxidoreductase [Geminicoccaceae bacterium]
MTTSPADLIERLRTTVGADHCITGDERLGWFTTDWRKLCDGRALAAVRPASTDEVAGIVRHCAEAGVPIVPQGGNTGLVGGGAPHGPEPAVVVNLVRMNRVLDVDATAQTITVEAGCALEQVQHAADEAGCLFPLALGSQGSCQIGGNLSTNAGGNTTIRYGNARELTLGLEVVLPDGRIWSELQGLRKDNVGYDLKQLFIGAEGSLGIITKAVLKVVPKPTQTATAMVGFDGLERLPDVLNAVRRAAGDHFTAIELMPREAIEMALHYLEAMRDPLEQTVDWYVLLDLSSAQSEPQLDGLLEEALAPLFENGAVIDAVVAKTEAQRRQLWFVREAIDEGQHQHGQALKYDVSVPIAQIVPFIEKSKRRIGELTDGIVLAFGHVGDGNIHLNVCHAYHDPEGQALTQVKAEVNELVQDGAVELGGSISAAHGVGRIKQDLFSRHRPLSFELCRKLKKVLDPDGIMNPGVLVP